MRLVVLGVKEKARWSCWELAMGLRREANGSVVGLASFVLAAREEALEHPGDDLAVSAGTDSRADFFNDFVV